MPDHAAPPAAPATGRPGRLGWPAWLLLAGIVALAFNLRGSITSLPPLFPELGSRLRLSSPEIAALAAAPVLCFGVFSGAAAPLSRRFGEERVLLGSLLLLVAGLVLRGAFPGWALFPGTALAGAAIAFMNVLLPSLVKRRDPARAGWLIGTYLACLCAGAIVGSLIAVPLYRAAGGSVPLALGLWALPAALAAVAWLPQRRFRTVPPAAPALVPGTAAAGTGWRAALRRRAGVSRYLLAWQVMGFMGLQSLIYYATLSWLPILFRDRGSSAAAAGTLLALLNLGNGLGALLVPVLAHRRRDSRGLAAATAVIGAAGLTGIWLAPLSTAAVWTLLLGLGQGAALGLAIYLMAARAPDARVAASLSAFAQGAGYLVATAGPLLIGLLHSVTGGWTAPVIALLVFVGGEAVAGWLAARPRVLGHEG
ncbi:MAG TPA: MFS transporter [Streptosporangiaceae bacterium]|nr:MFS transporter [Streptosporangiaceae bacterium]